MAGFKPNMGNGSLQDFLKKGRGQVYGQDNDKLAGEDVTYEQAQETMAPKEESSGLDPEMASAIGDLMAGPKQSPAPQFQQQAINPQTTDVMQARRQALMNLIKGQ